MDLMEIVNLSAEMWQYGRCLFTEVAPVIPVKTAAMQGIVTFLAYQVMHWKCG